MHGGHVVCHSLRSAMLRWTDLPSHHAELHRSVDLGPAGFTIMSLLLTAIRDSHTYFAPRFLCAPWQ